MVLVSGSLREELISTFRLLTQLKSRESSYPRMPTHRPHLWPASSRGGGSLDTALKSCLCESHSPLRLMGPEVLFRDCPGLQFRLGIPVVLALGRL